MPRFINIRETQFRLHAAAEANNCQEIKKLLKKGIDINEINNFGDTALVTATFNKNTKVVELLLKKKANTEIKTSLSQSTALHTAVQYNLKEIVYLLLQNNANVDSRDKKQLTPLHLAARLGDEAILKTLLEAGGNPNVRDNLQGQTPLHYATTCANLKNIILLVEFGCGINQVDYWDESPIFYARQPNIADLLLTLGADISITNKENKTAFTVNNCHSFSPSLALTFAEHTIKLQCANFPISEDNIEALLTTKDRFNSEIFGHTRLVNDQHWELFEQECLREILELKKLRVGKGNFYNFIGAHPDIVARATKDENLIKKYFNRTLILDFPHYAWLIELQYRQGINRSVKTIIGTKKINQLLGTKLPEACTEAILKFLDNPTLNILRQVSLKKE